MIVFVYGTTAEAIKIAPVARRLAARGVPYEQWITQQHTAALRQAIPELGLDAPTRVIAEGWRGKPLKTPLQMMGWAMDVVRWGLVHLGGIKRTLPEGSVIIVHGDTMTTVLGTFMGRRLRLPVAHIEAGLRSGNWRHPFPEELDRRVVGRFATIHYVPSEEAAHNLRRRDNVVLTHGNTAKDAVTDAAVALGAAVIPEEAYGLVLLHRFEFISDPALVRETLRTLDAHTTLPLRLIVDQYSRGAIEATIADLGLTRIEVTGKLEHAQFVATMRSAAFIVTDSGGIQQEAAVLGIPTLIHRMVTEGAEGIGTSALISGWDQNVVRDFLGSFARYRQAEVETGPSPSDIIVDDLMARGLAVPGPSSADGPRTIQG